MTIKKFVPKTKLDERVEKAARINIEISEVYQEYAKLKDVFSTVFNEPSTTFKLVVDGFYYLGGGYPKDDSIGRMELKIKEFAMLYKFFAAAGSDSVKNELQKYGLSCVEIDPLADNVISDIEREFVKQEHKYDIEAKTTHKLLTELIAHAEVLQKQICLKADIRKDLVKNSSEFSIDQIETKRLISLRQLEIKEKDKLHESKRSKILTSLNVFSREAQ